MDIYSKKYKLMEWIINLRDTQMIDRLLIIAEKSDWWEEVSQVERDSIVQGLKDIEQNKVYNQTDVQKNYEKYL